MNKTFSPDLGILVLRIGMGLMMLTHGWPKLLKLFGGGEIQFADPIGLGPTFSLILTVFAEFLCSIFIVIGFKTRWASVPLFITMLVATFIIHGSDPFGDKEFPLLYATGYLALFFIGSGKYSLDQLMSKS